MKINFWIVLITTMLIGLAKAEDFESRYFNFLEQVFLENVDGKNNQFLKKELLFFQKKFPDSPNRDQVIWMFADLARTEGNELFAFFNYTKLAFLNPDGRFYNDAITQIDSALNQNRLMELTETKDLILKQLALKNKFASHREAYFEFLSFVYMLNLNCASKALIFEIDLFREIYHGDNQYSDVLCFWKGTLQEKLGAYNSALSSYQQVRIFRPDSDLIDEALYKISRLQFRVFGKLEIAEEGFLELINAFSDSPAAGNAQLCLAELYEDSLKSHVEALNNYQLFIDAFPDHPQVLKALKRIASLALLLHKEAEALQAYMQIVQKFPEDDFAPTALEFIAQLYSDHFKDYERAANAHVIFASTFHNHPGAAEHLFLAAKLYKNELNDEQQLGRICDMLIQFYPESPFSRKAKEIIPKSHP